MQGKLPLHINGDSCGSRTKIFSTNVYNYLPLERRKMGAKQKEKPDDNDSKSEKTADCISMRHMIRETINGIDRSNICYSQDAVSLNCA